LHKEVDVQAPRQSRLVVDTKLALILACFVEWPRVECCMY